MKIKEKIGSLYVVSTGDSEHDKPTFIINFDNLPQSVQVNIETWIIAIDYSKNYKLHLKILDDNDKTFVDDDSIVLSQKPDPDTNNNVFEGNLIGGSFTITTQPMTILNKVMYTITLELLDEDGNFLDEATTYFYAKKSNEQ